jgi:hypothetical protein
MQEEHHMEREPTKAWAIPKQGPSRGYAVGAMEESMKPPAVQMK